MKIQIKLYASLRRFLPKVELGEGLEIDVSNKITIAKLVAKLKIPLEECHIILINGNLSDANSSLHPNDLIVIFPPMGGG
jgi:sulfur-carrier protein